ncbi:MAG: VanZ family protein [Pseudonocardiales bacterium]|nr:VanZ family protein [Pseudonocardiales bacterium]
MSRIRAAASIALAIYLGLLARVTLWPESSQRPVWHRLNAGSKAVSSGQIDHRDTEVLANIALFVPFGVLAVVVLRRVLIALAIAVALSAAIELTQHWWLPTRDGTVQDVALNVLGAAIGCALAWGSMRLVRGGCLRIGLG